MLSATGGTSEHRICALTVTLVRGSQGHTVREERAMRTVQSTVAVKTVEAVHTAGEQKQT